MIPVYAPKFRRAPLSAVMALAIFAVPTTGVFAQTRASTTITLNPSKDNTLIENGSGALSNGAGQNIYVGRINRSSGSIRRAVLAFDISSVPSGATVESVSLSLNMSRSRSGGQTINVHKLTADWGEGSSASFGGSGASSASNDATWVHRFFSSTSWSSAPMVTDVQAWVDASATNFGWLLKGNESSQQTVKKFDSGGNSVSSTPTRTPTPTPMPPPSTDFNAHTGAGAWCGIMEFNFDCGIVGGCRPLASARTAKELRTFAIAQAYSAMWPNRFSNLSRDSTGRYGRSNAATLRSMWSMLDVPEITDPIAGCSAANL